MRLRGEPVGALNLFARHPGASPTEDLALGQALADVATRLGPTTLHAWCDELCAHFDHPTVSNGPTENLNLKAKYTKRTARGYRKFR
jgi:hypothetical protein